MILLLTHTERRQQRRSACNLQRCSRPFWPTSTVAKPWWPWSRSLTGLTSRRWLGPLVLRRPLWPIPPRPNASPATWSVASRPLDRKSAYEPLSTAAPSNSARSMSAAAGEGWRLPYPQLHWSTFWALPSATSSLT
ncbi:UNVERIFIED_CONTAM: hypothetical protein GTU68_019243 [Idotea baltica]|nr:hypothetical protein [Idotea baltica]